MPISRPVNHIEGRSWCQNDPGRGATSSGSQKAAILDFQDGRHVKSTSANISACRPLRRPILVSKFPLSHIAFALFYEKAATASMIKHGMVVHRNIYATPIQNPGQIPVMAVDATLYALVKLVQWNWPQTHDKDKCLLMFGGLHIEMAMWMT